MMAGAEVAFNRSIPELIDDLGVIKPTALVSVPRIFERAYRAINTKVEEGSPLKKKLFGLAVDVGWLRYEHEQGRAAWHPKLLLWPLLENLVAAKIQNTFGGRLRIAISGGAPLAAHVAKLFISLGIRILQGYGLTETSPVLTVNTIERNRPDSIGLPINSVKLRIGDNDELLAQGPNIMLGYWRNETATKDVIDADSWFHTGDCARIEDGFLFITGRLKDILVLSNGEKVPPADMEAAISEDPLFDQSIVIGEGKPYLSAIVVLNPELWSAWAQEQGFDIAVQDIVDNGPVEQALVNRIAECIKAFPGYAQVYQACATLEPWSVENGLLTPTMKLKRPVIKDRFQQEINKMYEGH
jgi:long-chain acyl-CoA synthetase